MEPSQDLRAVKLLTWTHLPDSTVTGSLEWTPSGWIVTGDAGSLLTEYYAVLPTAEGPRQVTQDAGVLFLYAVWFSMRASCSSVELVDRNDQSLGRDVLLAELGLPAFEGTS